MNIALSTVSGVTYGGVTYFKNLLPALAKVDTANKYHIYVAKKSPMTALVSQDNFFFHECLGENNSGLQRFVWEQCALPWILRKDKIDVVFTAKNLDIFAARCKTIIAIRNVEPLFYAHYKNHWKLNVVSWFKRVLTRLSINSSDWIIAVSQSTRKALENLSQKAEGKVDVIYNGNPVEKRPSSVGSRKSARDFLLTSSKFVAYANQSSLIDAYAMLMSRRPEVPLLQIAGGAHDKAYFDRVKKQIRACGLEDGVRLLGLVPHDQLLELYSNALAFVFPSTLEACPQTLIEAMACGVPIAASNVPPMPEICGDAAIYFEPYDPEDIAAKIDLLITNEDLRNELKQQAATRAGFFDWRETAEQLLKVFHKIG